MEGMNGGALKRTLRGRRGRRKALALIGLAIIVVAAALAAWFLESQRAGQGAAGGARRSAREPGRAHPPDRPERGGYPQRRFQGQGEPALHPRPGGARRGRLRSA